MSRLTTIFFCATEPVTTNSHRRSILGFRHFAGDRHHCIRPATPSPCHSERSRRILTQWTDLSKVWYPWMKESGTGREAVLRGAQDLGARLERRATASTSTPSARSRATGQPPLSMTKQERNNLAPAGRGRPGWSCGCSQAWPFGVKGQALQKDEFFAGADALYSAAPRGLCPTAWAMPVFPLGSWPSK